MNDRELLDRLRSGSREAFDTIFRAHYARLVALSERMLRDRAAAEEVVQEVMLALWRRRADLTIDTTLQAYLFRATRNRALNQIRHERIVQRAAPYVSTADQTAQPAEDALIEQELESAVRAAVGTLPDRCREIFELSRVHGLKYAEIASTLDISIKTVEAQMGKALRLLRERLTHWLP